MPVLSLDKISFSYGDKIVLKDISYEFEKGKMYCIVGRSGAGKTTLLSVISGLAAPTGGSIYYDGKDIKDIGKYKFRSRYIGVIFQNYNLLTKFTALENVMLSMDIAGVKGRKKQKAMELLADVGLEEDEADRRILKLSGGQQQRVAIARALSYDADIILADEPTGNLDSENSKEIMKLLRYSNRTYDQTLIVITHDENIALQADRIISLEDGRIVRDEVIR